MFRALAPTALLALLGACASAPPASLASLQSLHVANASDAEGPDLYCSGQPTPEQFAKLKQHGIDRVVCLRAKTESGTGWEEGLAPHSGLEFLRLVIEGPADLTAAKAREFAAAIGGGSTTLVACGSSNRVGAMMALKAKFVDGKTKEEALAIGKACGLAKLEDAVTEALAK
jgi:protein tyrosine phosphatase (PTP) superfamily phosphohydrolase (DUF442 family)